MSEIFKQMTTEEINEYVRLHPDDEVAYIEYSSRLQWKKPPHFSTSDEERQFIEQLIAEKTKKTQ